ncbi:MAG TPA: polysaccharide deacetylase family protein [Candidatus Saccharimonadia bacterium]|nr:polysaccharide deacetylase family protein [Candidatus Saccharimonadia bacterium]
MSTSKTPPKRGKKKKKLKTRPGASQRRGTWLAWLGVLVVLAGSGLAMAFTFPTVQVTLSEDRLPVQLRAQYAQAASDINTFENREQKLHSVLVSNSTLANMLSNVELDAAGNNLKQSKSDLKQIHLAINNWNLELDGGSGVNQLATDGTSPDGTTTTDLTQGGDGEKFLPIVMYHYTPPDFTAQLEYLVQHNYTTITMRQAVAGLEGGTLPAKPVALTFDDGYENQMQAFSILEEFHMKATFYIINGGSESDWCIGAGRKYHLPSQPAGGCGDAYLTWGQIRQLDKSGLIEIGGHTVDHENLASLTPSDQQFEIDASKTGIEQELGHPIYDFAYPYGEYDATTIQLVQAAGYESAVTTLPSNYQISGEPFTLRRIRDTETLP